MNTEYHFVFDIDETLAMTIADSKQARFFQQYGAAFYIKMDGLNYPHYLFPGVLELFKLLDQTPNVRFSFYSSAICTRNLKFARKLLETALGQKRYREITEKVVVLSRKHLQIYSSDQTIDQCAKYGILHRQWKKDLSIKSLGGNKKTADPNTVLIDDNLSNAVPGQEKHILQSPSVDLHKYLELEPCLKNSGDTSSRFPYTVNHIYYITGLIFKAMEKSREERKPISEILHNWQYKKKEDGRFDHNFPQLQRSDDLYVYGLRKLREINPKLSFTTHESYNQVS